MSSNLLAILNQVEAGLHPAEEEDSPVPEDKLAKVYELRLKGVPVNNIAASFRASPATIYRWLEKYKREFDSQLVNKPRSELLLDMIRFTRAVRDVAMSQVHQIDVAALSVNSQGATVQDVTKMDLKAKGTFLKLALDAESKSFEMLQKTGVLPTAVKEIHYSLKETQPSDKQLSSTPTRTKEEMINHITELVSGGRIMPKLDEMADNIVMDTEEAA